VISSIKTRSFKVKQQKRRAISFPRTKLIQSKMKIRLRSHVLMDHTKKADIKIKRDRTRRMRRKILAKKTIRRIRRRTILHGESKRVKIALRNLTSFIDVHIL
jgi:hypothetical protein